MPISDLSANKPVSDIKVTIVEANPARQTRAGLVRTCVCEDDSGRCELSIWNADCEKYGPGDIVSITKGWCGEYMGKLQLSAGKFGRIEKVGEKKQEKGEAPEKASKRRTVVENHLRPTISQIRGKYKEERILEEEPKT